MRQRGNQLQIVVPVRKDLPDTGVFVSGRCCEQAAIRTERGFENFPAVEQWLAHWFKCLTVPNASSLVVRGRYKPAAIGAYVQRVDTALVLQHQWLRQ